MTDAHTAGLIAFSDVQRVFGPLAVVAGVSGVGYDELVELEVQDGSRYHGVVLEVDRDLAVVQVFEGTRGIGRTGVSARFSGRPMEIPIGEGWLGRVVNGRGEPLDGGPPVLGPATRPIEGAPLNPAHRDAPHDPVVTGVSVLDGLATLVRGQKLPVFSQGGLPHLRLASQIAVQAHAGDESFRIVFCAMGITHADADAVAQALEARSAKKEIVLVQNTADDPVIERILSPRLALTVAEHLAFELGHHVLVIMADMTSYCEAVREVSSSRGDIPARRGYPGFLYSDLASLYERSGRLKNRDGSLTQLPVLTMPGGDLTHPVPDLTGYITEGQIVLTPELSNRSIYPPVDVLQSLSRLMRLGVGKDRTRDDHLAVANQVYAALARSRQARDLGELVGEDALSETDRRFIAFADAFEKQLLSQDPEEDRDLNRTLDLAWEVLSSLPRRELTMISTTMADAHYREAARATANATR
ncbi:MAG: V-type ATP synthase subunit B [Gemmatimonadaceae bacterium]